MPPRRVRLLARRIGIYGGTFDPVHYGHLILAESAREQAELDEVWFLPTRVPPHKQDGHVTDGNLRADLLEIALAGMREFKVDRRELRRRGASYTFETLTELHHEFPDVEFHFIMGADSFLDFPTWRKPQEILSLAHLVVSNRGTDSLPSLESLKASFGEEAANRVKFVRMPSIDISSREIRRKVNRRGSIRFLVPRAVEQVIVERKLYVVDREETSPADSTQST